MQLPQWLTSVEVFVSHPFAKLPSQLENGAAQVVIVHTPLMHVAVPFGTVVGQVLPHWPQLALSLARFLQTPLQSV